jgi:hypothetical protein
MHIGIYATDRRNARKMESRGSELRYWQLRSEGIIGLEIKKRSGRIAGTLELTAVWLAFAMPKANC